MKKYFAGAALLGLIALAGCDSSSSVNSGAKVYTQVDRLARPVVNEVFATVANGRHKANNEISPSQDAGASSLEGDINSFMKGTAGRSDAVTAVVKSVLVPDVMIADLDQAATTGAYLGVETGGATGNRFGGRALLDDVADTSLGVVFGNTVSALGLAADDGKAIPALTTDNVGPGGKHFTTTFPYLGAPQ